MNEGDKENVIKEILSGSILTTVEIEKKIGLRDIHCPDDIAKILSQMRKKGIISGKLSIEKGAWVWWVEE